jgi:sec-independent protein translocase protein TatA
MGIGNIGWTEFIVILAIALIFFGPRRLPGIAQTLGKSLREFQKALNEVKSEIVQAGREADTREDLKRILPRPAELSSQQAQTAPTPGPTEPEITKEAEVPQPPGSPGDAPNSNQAEYDIPAATDEIVTPDKRKGGDGDAADQDVT